MANHLYNYGSWIFISAFPLKDKTEQDIYKSGHDKRWGHSADFIREPVVGLLAEVIPEKVAAFGFMDCQ